MPELTTQPSIYLITHTAVDWGALVRLLEDEGLPPLGESLRSMRRSLICDVTDAGDLDALGTIETAARLCYFSFSNGRNDIAAFIENLLSKGDGSVLEHVNYGFCFTNVSRSYSLEQVRHRVGFAYSQLSQRYVDSSTASFVVPPALLNELDKVYSNRVLDVLDRAAASALGYYDELIMLMQNDPPPVLNNLSGTDLRKAIRSSARAVLPNNTETKIMVSANVRAWRHFIGMRAHAAADLEIRRLAIGVLRILQAREPLLFGDFTITRHIDDTEIATPKYWKV